MTYEYYKMCPVCNKRRIKDKENLCWYCKTKKKTNYRKQNRLRRAMKEYSE